MDPLMASYPWYTPYQFAGNMPIIAIDLDGLEEFIMIDQGNGTYKAIWNIKARDKGQAGTIMFVTNEGGVKKESEITNLTTYQRQNSTFIKNHVNIKGNADSKNVIHYEEGSSNTEGYPITILKKKTEDGRPYNSGEGTAKEEELFPPPPPAPIKNNPVNNGGNGNANNNNVQNIVPNDISFSDSFVSWSTNLANPLKMAKIMEPYIVYLLKNPDSKIEIVTNGGAPGSNWNSTQYADGTGEVVGPLVDKRNKILKNYLISKGVKSSQIKTSRGTPNQDTKTSAKIVKD